MRELTKITVNGREYDSIEQMPPEVLRDYLQAMGAVPAATSVDDTPTGGVVRFTAMDPSQVQALRDEVQENVRSMERGCAGVP